MSGFSVPYEFPPVVSAEEMRGLERQAADAGFSEESLMDEAGTRLARMVRRIFPHGGTALIFAGKGHNAGDAFALAGHLLDAGWRVELRLAWTAEALRPLAAKKLDAIRSRDGVTFTPVASEQAVDTLHIIADELHILDVKTNYFDTNHYYTENNIPSHEETVDKINKIILNWR